MKEIEVVSGDSREVEYEGGIGWGLAFETETAEVGEIRVCAGTKGGWHHHGRRTLYGYVVSGEFMLELGTKGERRIKLSRGDLFQVPPGLVHRDANPSREDAVLVIFNVGPGKGTFDVAGPQRS